MAGAQVLRPVPPSAHELPVIPPGRDDVLATARLMAASLPGTGDSQWSAWVAVLDSLVSSTITFAPRDRAVDIRCACGLK